MLTNGRVINIRLGNVNKPVVEDIANEQYVDTAIFGTQYRQMLSLLNKYVGYREKTDDILYGGEPANNVFSFVGERGSGKTSCMSSISHLLTNGKIHQFHSYERLIHTSFASIDIIDPSYFDEKHNIVAMMVAKLYKSFSRLEADNHAPCNFDVRNDLIEAFARAQRSMRCLLDDSLDDEMNDDIEHLADLAIAIDLKNDIQHLVKTYLQFVKKDNGILILSIDDIDLNVGEADTMAEQIRKYLVSPNIVILLAAKLDQLATIKNLHYAEKYHYLIDNGHVDYEIVEEMTGQFLTKFAPHDQRVYMPSFDFYLESGMTIDGNNMHGDNVMQVVPALIFDRTRYLFYNTKQTASFIIPRNLRKMCQLVAMLWAMESYEKADKDSNKQIFRNYLFGSWMQDNLVQKDRHYIMRILEGWRNEQLNKIALDVLHEKYKSWIDKQLAEDNYSFEQNDLKEEIKAIFDERNREYNFSIGDIMSLVNTLQVSFDTHADKCFFFILKSIYSMALYENYDMITDEQDMEGYDEFAESKKEDNSQVLLYDPFSDEHVSSYHKLVGGRFFNYRLEPVFPKELLSVAGHKYWVSRSDRRINYDVLKTLMTDAINAWGAYHEEENTQHLDSIKRKVRLAEFFMLCSIRDINMQNAKGMQDYYEPNFRRSDNVCYNGEFTGKKWLYFDLGAFFYNITCMCDCYRRFGQLGRNLLDLCKVDKLGVSLFSSFRKEAIAYRSYLNNPHAWQSWASVRNAEILFDLNQHLRSKCRRMNMENDSQFLCRYFRVLADYEIKTYDRNEEGTQLSIGFGFASQVSDLLSQGDIKNYFSVIFESMDSDVSTQNMPFSNTAHLINVDALLKGRMEKRNKKSTLLKYLYSHETAIMKDYDSLITLVFDHYGDYMSREEIRKAANDTNILLYQRYGNTSSDNQDAVPREESVSSVEGE